MHIIFGSDKINNIDSKYTVLELDTIKVYQDHDPVTAYCLIENIPINEIVDIQRFKDLHDNLIKNYQLGNFKYCQDALEHLIGKWNREIDSFYLDLLDRIKQHQDKGLPGDWTGIIDRTKDTEI